MECEKKTLLNNKQNFIERRFVTILSRKRNKKNNNVVSMENKIMKKRNEFTIFLDENKLKTEKIINETTRSTVVLVMDPEGKLYILKIKKRDHDFFHLESKNLDFFDHPNIVKKLGTFHTPNYSILKLNYFPGVSLVDFILKNGPIGEPELKNIGRKILNILQYIEDKKMAYMDIKPDNMIIDPVTFDISFVDFEMVFKTGPFIRYRYLVGTEGYIAPEMMKGKYYYAPKTMIWSLGVTLFVMKALIFPKWEKISEDNITLLHMNYSENFKNLMDRMLDRNPKTRITLKSLTAHIFFNS
jgi:serine/threonine protein kinase